MNLGIHSYQSTKQLSALQNQFTDAATRLTTGKRINSSKDDAAGLAIATRLEAISRALDTGIRNASNAVSVVETADSAAAGIESSLQRLRELSIQSANGILSNTDREAISAEAEQLKSEIGRVIDTTEFNGKKILSEDQALNIQVGSNSADQISVSTQGLSNALESTGFDNIDLSTQAGSNDALQSIDAMLATTSNRRSEYGALNNRFSSIVESLSSRKVATSESSSKLTDADIAAEAANLSRASLLENANIAIQAQANANAGSVLRLLNG